ncbi:myosin-11-like isoform X1 [Mya arenaria]|nr:myosin-11-like isoform X1 [Mya arenaria]
MGNQCCGNEHKEYQSGDEKSHKSKGASTSTSSKAASSNNEQARVNVQTRQPMPIKHSDWQNEVNENPRQESYQRPQSRDQHAPMKTEKPKQEQTKGLEKYKKKSKKAPKQPLTEGGNGIIHERLQREIDDLRKHNEESKHAADAEKTNRIKVEEELDQKKKELDSQTRELQTLQKQSDGLKKEIDDLKKEKSHEADKEKENNSIVKDELKRTKEKLDSTTKQLQSLQQEGQDMSTHYKEIQRQLNDAEKVNTTFKSKLEDLEREKQNLLTRLSAAMSAKLTDNNPDIADLSDSNRPTKLAEFYSELYDNEWTNAFEVIKNKHSEDETIRMLLDVLVNVYTFCKKKAENDLKGLRVSIEKFSLNKQSSLQIVKKMKDERKKEYSSHLEEVLKEVQPVIQRTFNKEERNHANIVQYVERCVKICWLMVVQDPPLYIDSNVNTGGERFQTNVYKAYMVNGQYVDFVVWPVLYLHEKGNILCKGVAQGRATSTDSEPKPTNIDKHVEAKPDTRKQPEKPGGLEKNKPSFKKESNKSYVPEQSGTHTTRMTSQTPIHTGQTGEKDTIHKSHKTVILTKSNSITGKSKSSSERMSRAVKSGTSSNGNASEVSAKQRTSLTSTGTLYKL